MLATGKAATAAPATTTAPRDRAEARQRAGALVDVLATLAVLVAAFAARYPYVYTAPRFRDDTFNALHSLKIYRGEHFPFTDVEAYIGGFFNYAVAAGMFVVGPTIYAARLVVMWFGVLTVGATYFLGRELGGPNAGTAVGLIAAALHDDERHPHRADGARRVLRQHHAVLHDPRVLAAAPLERARERRDAGLGRLHARDEHAHPPDDRGVPARGGRLGALAEPADPTNALAVPGGARVRASPSAR